VPLGIEYEGAVYHLLEWENVRQRIFESEGDRTEFLSLIEKSPDRFSVGPSR
jgi:hypothetical protein